ncbi:MAG TPA: cupin domain-containing protein [Acidimicrobiales bacterium]|jgi:mannose-6-phosphate isomerase-like protein (cupin superfamily)|nr:cupin domain-containing protein [Acidimicrobiales bacterium]HWI02708.1 cupin domain-containing protein [Acidimicrobiales bacterium]
MTAGFPYHLPTEHGATWWFLDTLMTIKAGGGATNGAFTLIEFVAPEGFAPPLHIHESEDEAFYVLEGEVDVMCGEERWSAVGGSFVFLPRGVAHSFRVNGGRLLALQLTVPSGFEAFVEELGRRPDHPGLPDPSEPDVTQIVEMSARHGYRILGPSPLVGTATGDASEDAVHRP